VFVEQCGDVGPEFAGVLEQESVGGIKQRGATSPTRADFLRRRIPLRRSTTQCCVDTPTGSTPAPSGALP